MKLCIFGDTHSNLEATDAIIEDAERYKPDEWYCLGDLVGYGVDPNKVMDRVYGRVPEEHIVIGNNDLMTIQAIDYYRAKGKWHHPSSWGGNVFEAIKWTAQNLSKRNEERLRKLVESKRYLITREDPLKRLLFAHSSPLHPNSFVYIDTCMDADNLFFKDSKLSQNAIAFAGHTHTPLVCTFDGETVSLTDYRAITDDWKMSLTWFRSSFVTIPSVGQPRDGNNKSGYALYNSDSKVVGIKRVAYDIEAAKNKIKKAGLPIELAFRLSLGK